jgi:L-ascorbate metabolism protein UlaG (beta-lactamase superfamily)
MNHSTTIWYIYHSGFAVKTENHLLVFDYYRDGIHFGEAALLSEMYGTKTLVFSSHGHGDHFSPAVFKWQKEHSNIAYVLSDDIETGRDKRDVTFVRAGNHYRVGEVHIETLASTDLGVAFLVHCDGISIFHAGDLNWWHWEGEPEEDNRLMSLAYKEQIDLLKGRKIDLAFIPVDPRLEEQCSWGLEYFMQEVGAGNVFPMHFGQDYSIFARLRKELSSEKLKYIAEITPMQYCFDYARLR